MRLLQGKAALRETRTLAAIYDLQQQIVMSSFVREALAAKMDTTTPAPKPSGADVVTPPTLQPVNAEKLLAAERELTRAKQSIIRTWLEYQSARLSLYRRLGATPPEFKR